MQICFDKFSVIFPNFGCSRLAFPSNKLFKSNHSVNRTPSQHHTQSYSSYFPFTLKQYSHLATQPFNNPPLHIKLLTYINSLQHSHFIFLSYLKFKQLLSTLFYKILLHFTQSYVQYIQSIHLLKRIINLLHSFLKCFYDYN